MYFPTQLYVRKINVLQFGTVPWPLILGCHHEKNQVQVVGAGCGPEPRSTEVSVSTSGVRWAQGWGSSEEYYILKGRYFFPSSEDFQILALKRGKKVCLFFEILAFSEKTTLSPSLENFKQSDREVRIPLVEEAAILKAATGYKLLEGPGAQNLFVFTFNKLNEK